MRIATFAIGPIGAALLGLISVPIMSWYFSVEDIGRLAMLQLTTSFGILLFSLGLDQAFVREFHESTNVPGLLINTLAPGCLLLGLFLGACSFQAEAVAEKIFGLQSLHLGYLALLCIFSAFLTRFLSLILRMQNRGISYSVALLFPKIVFLLIVSLYIFFDYEITTLQAISSHALSTVAVFLFLVWVTRDTWLLAIKQRIDIGQLRKMFAYSVHLIFSGLAYWGLVSVDRYFLQMFSGYEELGVYSVATNFAALGLIFQGIFTTIWAPVVYKWVSEGEDISKIEKVIHYVLFLIVLLFALTGMFSWVIDFILPDSFGEVRYLVVACLGFPLLYTLSEATSVGTGITRKTIYALLATLISLSFNFIGSYILIPLYGAKGAAISTCVAFWIFFVLRTEFSMYVWQSIPRFSIYFWSLTCVVCAVFSAVYGAQNHDANFLVWLGIFVGSLVYFRSLITQATGVIVLWLRRVCSRAQ